MLTIIGSGTAISLITSACTISPYAAQVGTQYISVNALNAELHAIAGNPAFVSSLTANEKVFGNSKSTFTTQFVDQVLNMRIGLTLIENANHKLHLRLSKTDTEIAGLTAQQTYGGASVFAAFPSAYQKELIADAGNIAVLESYLTHTNISLSSLSNYYHANISLFTRICAAHIVVSSAQTATTIYNQVHGGASFATLAKTQSLDPNTAPNGGYIGCGTYGNFASAFGTSFASELVAGQQNVALQPVQITGGYSVPMVVSKTALSFSEAIPAVIGTMFGSQGSSDLNAFVSGLAKRQNITVNPVYGTYSNAGVTSSVVPPPLPAF